MVTTKVVVAALVLVTGIHGIKAAPIDFSAFPPYLKYGTKAPAWIVTPGRGRALHRFFDSSPISPGGRWMALLRLPYEDRRAQPGDAADVFLVDLKTGRERKFAAGYSLSKVRRMNFYGYGAAVPESAMGRNGAEPEDDGLFVIDLATGERKLLKSIAAFFRETLDEEERRALSDCGSYGYLRIMKFDVYGAKPTLFAGPIFGSGHPSVSPDGKWLVTDAYLGEPVAYPDGTVPIRLVELATLHETEVARVRTEIGGGVSNGEFRTDPHPAWSADGRYVTINAFEGGTRRVIVLDVSAWTCPGKASARSGVNL